MNQEFKNQTYDFVIIGGGIIGAIVAYQLCRYHLKIALFEKNPVFADETSKGNSGIIHGGFDPKPNTLEAKLNVLGNYLWSKEIFHYLTFPKKKVDSLVIAFNESEMEIIHSLYQRGLQNKVKAHNLKIIKKKELLAIEPNINPKVIGGLVCNSSWMIDPVQATYTLLKCAYQNGVEVYKNTKITHICYEKNWFEIKINNNLLLGAKNIINAAGHYADVISALAGYPDFSLKTRRGEYRILDRSLNGVVSNICFMVPSKLGKGVLVSPMLDGHILIGPTAEEGVKKEDTRVVTLEQYNYIGKMALKIIPKLDISKTVMTLAGSRPIDLATNDFIIAPAKANKHFINIAGTQSPALSSAPAIALEVIKIIENNKTPLVWKNNFNPYAKIFF